MGLHIGTISNRVWRQRFRDLNAGNSGIPYWGSPEYE